MIICNCDKKKKTTTRTTHSFSCGNITHVGLGGGTGGGQLMGVTFEVTLQLGQVTGSQMFDLGEVAFD